MKEDEKTNCLKVSYKVTNDDAPSKWKKELNIPLSSALPAAEVA
jgi:hypothetical protein